MKRKCTLFLLLLKRNSQSYPLEEREGKNCVIMLLDHSAEWTVQHSFIDKLRVKLIYESMIQTLQTFHSAIVLLIVANILSDLEN